MVSLIVGAILVPFLFVAGVSGAEYLATPRRLWDVMADVGWDLCILGMGVAGGMSAAPEMAHGWGPEGALLAAVIVIAVNLLAGLGIRVLRRALGAGRLVGNACLLLGVFAVALPSVLTFWE